MSKTTRILWADHSWNPWTGCVPVSEGCHNCYAMRLAERRRGTKAFPQGFDLTLRPHKMKEPLTWKTPARIFVNSMSDLFLGAMARAVADGRMVDRVPAGYLRRVWATMLEADWHQYQILTKRPVSALRMIWDLGLELAPHIWIGVSVENQHWADIRIPQLLEIPAAVRFVSLEPLLGPVDLRPWIMPWFCQHCNTYGPLKTLLSADPHEAIKARMGKKACVDLRCGASPGAPLIAWVIDGGESGPGRRPADPDWFRANRDACTTAGVAYLHKQASGQYPGSARYLDGHLWEQYPMPHPMTVQHGGLSGEHYAVGVYEPGIDVPESPARLL